MLGASTGTELSLPASAFPASGNTAAVPPVLGALELPPVPLTVIDFAVGSLSLLQAVTTNAPKLIRIPIVRFCFMFISTAAQVSPRIRGPRGCQNARSLAPLMDAILPIRTLDTPRVACGLVPTQN